MTRNIPNSRQIIHQSISILISIWDLDYETYLTLARTHKFSALAKHIFTVTNPGRHEATDYKFFNDIIQQYTPYSGTDRIIACIIMKDRNGMKCIREDMNLSGSVHLFKHKKYNPDWIGAFVSWQAKVIWIYFELFIRNFPYLKEPIVAIMGYIY